ncbi:class I SAM-dependent methyltransferase [Trinickia violacea]|uniref:class I SAM-dependent methyltransferase n=1 Tax=Trinickia violacea TaxID=2571746 RepID=UPI00267244F1|nr:class I SAM-dependent methyltransferase [Trinickia violacea]
MLPPNIRLINERAQKLSLETGSVDYVLSHMALMLMDDIEQVMREIRRVLRRGGRFVAIIGRAFLLGEVGEAFLNVFRPIAKAYLTHLRFGDSRTRCEAGWRELLQHGFANVTFEDIDVEWTPTPEQRAAGGMRWPPTAAYALRASEPRVEGPTHAAPPTRVLVRQGSLA